MNIQEAKNEIIHAVWAYTRKDEKGNYKIPALRQRPILLIGPPGIGKTAIMEQIARECSIGLVAYTITHHTRQSAVGLPVIEHRTFDGNEYTVTEYTMSEIIASVYTCMENTGYKEGILFIDEINCVSETLAPTMLQFLQCKTFGSHKVPEGWVIAAAGNPPEYNKSVREFDIVTLDRVKRIVIEENYEVWKEYAYANALHGAIISYLNLKPANFYQIENTASGKQFVTARGWEDLSEILYAYEEMEIAITADLTEQYLQKPDIARDFAGYYQLYLKYRSDYSFDALLEGKITEEAKEENHKLLEHAQLDERIAVVGLLLDALQEYFSAFGEQDAYTVSLHSALGHAREPLLSGIQTFEDFIQEYKRRTKIKKDALLLSAQEERIQERTADTLQEYQLVIKKERITNKEDIFNRLESLLDEAVRARKEVAKRTSIALNQAFSFIEQNMGVQQEMILFVGDLSKNETGMEFIRLFGCPAYFTYSKKLLFSKREEEIQREIAAIENI